MAINVEPDSRTLSSSVAWPWKSRYIEKICLSWFEADWQKQGWMHMLVFALLFEYHTVPCAPCFPCADPGFFVRGPGQSDKKKPWQRCFFFSPQLILLKSNGLISKKTIIFQGSRGDQTFSRGGVGGGRGGPTFSRGVQLLIPYRNPYNLWFSRGVDPLIPLWIRTCYLDQQEIVFFSFRRRWVVFFSFI